MSQKLVYTLLKELGGTAKTKQIEDLAKLRYPDSTLYTYVIRRLQRLEHWGYVKKNKDGSWTIQDEYEENELELSVSG